MGRAKRTERLRATFCSGGFGYSVLHVARWFIRRTLRWIEAALVSIERRKHLVEPWTITARRFTIADNRRWWNAHDWSSRGEEWTPSAEWKAGVVERLLIRQVPEGGTAVEIGPGAGRWTEFLQRRADTLFVVDVSERAIELCRTRFAGCRNVHYLLTDRAQIDVADGIVDAIWSYDVFVHINPIDARSYFREFRRVLKPGGRAVIHHPGPPPPGAGDRPGTRSDLTDQMVLDFVHENDLELVEQTREFVNVGDVLSIVRKPAGSTA